MKASLYTAYHTPASIFDSASITPIHVGRASAQAPLGGMIGDDTGDNISDRNGAYCEMTALYWAWKNDRDSTHIGLMHYRRLLDFDGSMRAPVTEVFPDDLRTSDYCARTERWLAAHPQIDLVVPVAHRMPMTVRANFNAEHDPRDLAFVEAHVRAHSPDYLEDLHAVLDGYDLLLGNMFLARRDVIEPYFEWAFPILDALFSADIPRAYLSKYNARFAGFMSERLFSIYVHKFLREAPGARVHRVNILNLKTSLVFPVLPGAIFNGPENVNVAFSSDRNYLPHTCAMLRTMADHADPARQYNLFYLNENIRARDLELLQSVLFGAPNITLYPVNVGTRFGDRYRARHHAPSNATYNRFLLFDLLPDVDRLVYMDVDMVLLGDIAEVFDVEMGNHPIAAVPDFIMTRVLCTSVITEDPKVPDLGRYLHDQLGLSDAQINSYFNAGLMVLNLAKMDVPKVGKRLLAMVDETAYFFRDQDILNVFFKDSYLRLPAKYNVFNSDLQEYAHVPAANRRDAMAAKQAPFIIHFAAAHHKPWTNPDVQFAQAYWTALERTPFWLEVLEGTLARRRRSRWPGWSERLRRGLVRTGAWIGRTAPWLHPHLLGIYRRLRKAATALGARA